MEQCGLGSLLARALVQGFVDTDAWDQRVPYSFARPFEKINLELVGSGMREKFLVQTERVLFPSDIQSHLAEVNESKGAEATSSMEIHAKEEESLGGGFFCCIGSDACQLRRDTALGSRRQRCYFGGASYLQLAGPGLEPPGLHVGWSDDPSYHASLCAAHGWNPGGLVLRLCGLPACIPGTGSDT